MNALLTAIFEQKLDRVREIAARQPELLSERSASGSLPFQVAHSSGYIQITAALLRHRAPGCEIISDYASLLQEYLEDLAFTRLHRVAA